MTRRFAVVVNRAASGGRAREVLEEVTRQLTLMAVEHRVLEPDGLEDARRQARAVAESGDWVMALGGDGLVGPIAGELRETDGVLAVVPAGRGNDLARVLGIPTDPRAAVRLAVTGPVRRIDVGDVSGAAFVGIASLGFDSEANRIANESRLVEGNLVYLYAALRALAGWRPARFQVTVDGELHELVGYSVAIANSKAYGGGMWLAPHARIDDGWLEVIMVEEHSKLKALRDLHKVFKGTHIDDPVVHLVSGRRVEIAAERPFTVYADGDPIAELPAVVSVAERALRIVAPPVEAPTP